MNPRNTTLALLAATTLVVAGCSSNDRPTPMPPAANKAPTVATLGNVTIDQDMVVGPVEFAIGDDTTPANQLTVTAAVDGGSPIPADAVKLGGAGATRSITLTPLEASTGTANITISVVDAQGLKTTSAFSVVINARNTSVRDAVTGTFAKAETDAATAVNGFTFTQDADDPAAFAALLGEP